MPEKYAGVKFSTELKPGQRELEKAAELIKWCRAFYRMGIASQGGEVAGNISVRAKRGFLITPAGHDFSKITENELVEVVGVDEEKKLIKAVGKVNPSSEAFLHAGIYWQRKDVNAVLHDHNRPVTENPEKFGVIETEQEQPYGTVALRDEVLKILGKNKLVQMKNHGFIAMGKDIEEAGKIVLDLYKKSNPENCK